jgi:serpin B
MRWSFAAKRGLPLDLPEKSESPSTRFAFRLFRQLAAEPKAPNVFFSPASVMLCLWPLHDGATGETREAMAKVLEVAGLEPKELQSVVGTLRSALQIQSPGLKLEAANALWCNQKFRPRSEYISGVKEAYGAEVCALDFGGDQAVATINAWVAEKTHGKIGSILSSLDPLTFLVAINAVYFKDHSRGIVSYQRRSKTESSPHEPIRLLFLLRGLQVPGRASPIQDVTSGDVCLSASEEVEPA